VTRVHGTVSRRAKNVGGSDGLTVAGRRAKKASLDRVQSGALAWVSAHRTPRVATPGTNGRKTYQLRGIAFLGYGGNIKF